MDPVTATAGEDTTTPVTNTDAQETVASGVNTTISTVFVGGLAWATDEVSLRAHFEKEGLQIAEDSEFTNDRGETRPRPAVTVSKDKFSGRSNGYGFVNLASPEEANKAIEVLHESELDGRTIRVQLKEQKPKEDRPRRTGGDYNNRGGNSYGGDRRGGGDRGFGGGRRDHDSGNRREY